MNTANAHGARSHRAYTGVRPTNGPYSYGTHSIRVYAHVRPRTYSDGPNRSGSGVRTVRTNSAHTRTLGHKGMTVRPVEAGNL